MKNRWLTTAQVIKIKTIILCIYITLLFVTFSVIIASKIKLWFNWYSFYSLINFGMHDRFWQVSDTIGMPISQKLWIKLRNAFILLRLNENLFIYQLKEENAKFPTAILKFAYSNNWIIRRSSTYSLCTNKNNNINTYLLQNRANINE